SLVTPTATPSATGSCQSKYDSCRSVTDPENPPNYAQCAADFAGCKGQCYQEYNDCRSVRDPSNPPNNAQCASEFAGCLGFNPFANNGTNTVTPAVSSASHAGPTTVEYTTYTTVTTCPVTKTNGGHVSTGLTTSTVVVTSCKGGCGKQTQHASTSAVKTTEGSHSKPVTTGPSPTAPATTGHPTTKSESVPTGPGNTCPPAQTVTVHKDGQCPSQATMTVTETVYASMSSKPASSSSSWGMTGGAAKPTGYHHEWKGGKGGHGW
ncbi:hypothetical protein KC316_g18427, partial [Hortaea werneckii]